MKKIVLAATALLVLGGAARADVVLGGQTWTGTGTTLTLNAVVPGGNQPNNAPCIICGANQPGQPTGFGYNDFGNGGNVTAITAFSDQGAGGRNTLADNTFVNDTTGGYQIGDGSLFKAFLLAHGGTNANLTFSIGVDVNDTNKAQTLNSFFFLDLTTHTVLAAFTGGADGNVPSVNNGTGFPDYTLSGFTLNGINPGDEVIFAARMTGLNDGPDSFFIEPGVAAVPELSTWAMMFLGFAGVGTLASSQAPSGRAAHSLKHSPHARGAACGDDGRISHDRAPCPADAQEIRDLRYCLWRVVQGPHRDRWILRRRVARRDLHQWRQERGRRSRPSPATARCCCRWRCSMACRSTPSAMH